MIGQLGLILAALYLFRIEAGLGLMRLLPVIFCGFVIHLMLPRRARQPFFLLLSLAGILVVLGLLYGSGLILIGLALIGICHFPASLGVRVALVCMAALGLAGVRGEWVPVPGRGASAIVLPVLGSMFMFRLIIYLYDIRNDKARHPWSERLSYFFLLPNVCFPLFPVVDYQAFRRSYRDDNVFSVYQKGLSWMLRGLLHLIAYRIVYQWFVITPAEVTSLSLVVQAMVSTYLLYLRVSGLFHLIIGILCLFGYDLPETHNQYFLASSFNDYWRRINIYWKNFMMKLFYYPVMTRFKRFGLTQAMITATVVVFFATWLLHAYQWFWLRGTFLLTGPDAAFWTILGAMVVANSVWEVRRPRKRRPAEASGRFFSALSLSTRTVGMFVVLTVLWSLWSSPTLAEWWSLISVARHATARELGLLVAGLATFVGIGVAVQYLRSLPSSKTTPLRVDGLRSPALRTAAAAGLLLIGAVWAPTRFDGRAAEVLASAITGELSVRDEDQQERGYYEGLLVVDRQPAPFAPVALARQPDGWQGIRDAGVVRSTGDLLDYELLPSIDMLVKGVPFRTNRWGMKDREYARAKAPGTLRIAVLGSSHVMGIGVGNEESFSAVLESSLNRQHGDPRVSRFEVMNFAVGGYGATQSALTVERKVMGFVPDIVLFVAHVNDERRLIAHLSRVLADGIEIPIPGLREIVSRAGVRSGLTRAQIDELLRPAGADLVRWAYEHAAIHARRGGARPIWLYVPLTGETRKRGADVRARERLEDLAREAGFETWSIADAYSGQKQSAITLAPWDGHPNRRGHRLLAERLIRVLREHPDLLVSSTPFHLPSALPESATSNP